MHEERLRILHEMKQAEKRQSEKYPVHLSTNMRRIRKREKKTKKKENLKKRRIKDLAQKRRQYGEYINEFYLPKLKSNEFFPN